VCPAEISGEASVAAYTDGLMVAVRLAVVPAFLAGLLAACSGSVERNAVPPAAGGSAGSGTGGKGGTGTGGTGSTGGTGASGGSGGTVPVGGVTPTTRLARLTHTQYRNTVQELFGIADDATAEFAPDALNGFKYDTSIDFRVDARLGPQYRIAAETLAARAVTDDAVFARVVTCTATDAACRNTFISGFGQRAFRRPLATAEVTRFQTLFDQGPTLVGSGDAFKDGVRLVVEAMLQAPQFVYRTELSATAGGDGLIALDSWELASRLSYTLWDSMPDAALFTEAQAGRFAQAANVRAAAERMVMDQRALTKAVSFHAQALAFDRYSRIAPDGDTYQDIPDNFSGRARDASERFISEVYTTGGGIQELLTAPYAFADSELAPLYGKTESGGLTRIDFAATERKGLLMQVGFLASNAYSIKTDPIHRGLFVLRNLLCRVIDDPPPGASMTPPPETDTPPRTTREEVDLLTMQPGCGGCHSEINAPGFAFESFDAIGRARTMENGVTVDTKGELALEDGNLVFQNALEFVDGLAQSSEVHGCYAANWIEFAYGRRLSTGDDATRAMLATTPVGARALSATLTTTPAFMKRVPNEVAP
jgi:hypothetical protein